MLIRWMLFIFASITLSSSPSFVKAQEFLGIPTVSPRIPGTGVGDDSSYHAYATTMYLQTELNNDPPDLENEIIVVGQPPNQPTYNLVTSTDYYFWPPNPPVAEDGKVTNFILGSSISFFDWSELDSKNIGKRWAVGTYSKTYNDIGASHFVPWFGVSAMTHSQAIRTDRPVSFVSWTRTAGLSRIIDLPQNANPLPQRDIFKISASFSNSGNVPIKILVQRMVVDGGFFGDEPHYDDFEDEMPTVITPINATGLIQFPGLLIYHRDDEIDGTYRGRYKVYLAPDSEPIVQFSVPERIGD
jgi:hypothetical protein